MGGGCISASHPVGSGTVAPVAPEQDQQLVLSGAAASVGGEASPASRLVRICTFLHVNAASVWLIKRLQRRRKGQTLVSLLGRTVTDERTVNLSKRMHGRRSQVLKFKADSFISGP